MTSIHATIPSDLRSAALAARRRGEEPGSTLLEDQEQRPTLKGKITSSSSVVMKKLPQRIDSSRSAPVSSLSVQEPDCSSSEDDENSASKENDPMLSPTPVLAQSSRRPSLAKRPLSDLSAPVESDLNSYDAPCRSVSDQNIANNIPLSASLAPLEISHKGTQLSERSQSMNSTSRGLPSTSIAAVALGDSIDGRPRKRVCSDEGKENVANEQGMGMLPEKPLPFAKGPTKSGLTAPSKASGPSSLGVGNVRAGKSRVGLRRL